MMIHDSKRSVSRPLFSIILVILLISEIKGSAASHIPSDFIVIPRGRRETCGSGNQFGCRDGSCISSFLMCDGIKNCPDGSDEVLDACMNIQCPKNTFHCAYGACVDGNKQCNGQKDCADNSDELLLECPGFRWLNDKISKICKKKEFQCRNGDCINKFNVCDGIKDCLDGTDETVTHCNAPYFSCPKGSFRCGYGACIDSLAKCNGVKDCVDGSDEDVYICNKTSNESQDETTSRPIKPVLTTLQPSIPPPGSFNHNCNLPSISAGTMYEHVRKNVIKVSCDENYVLKFEESPYMVCIKGQWSPSQVCLPLCKPLKSISVTYRCDFNGQSIDCNSPVRPGTVATAACAPGYFDLDLFTSTINTKNYCLEKGEWQYNPYKCYEDCGIIYNPESIKPQIANGNNTTIAKFPWNVGIYLKNGGGFRHICGGTLISAYSVLTAAHCVTDDFGNLTSKEDLKLAFGKYSVDWDIETSTTQKRDILAVFVPEEYQGQFSHLKYDIAVIELKIAVIVSYIILPICIPHGNEIISNKIGLIAGWGNDESNTKSVVLKSAELPFINRTKCMTLVPQNEEKVTEDKFCADIKNGTNVTNVMQGDSGAGFVFKASDRYYIYGIVSTKINNIIPTFTDINYEFNRKFFIRTHLQIQRKHV